MPPVHIFTYVEHSYDPIVAAVSTLVIVVTLAVIAAIEKAVGLDQAFDDGRRSAGAGQQVLPGDGRRP